MKNSQKKDRAVFWFFKLFVNPLSVLLAVTGRIPFGRAAGKTRKAGWKNRGIGDGSGKLYKATAGIRFWSLVPASRREGGFRCAFFLTVAYLLRPFIRAEEPLEKKEGLSPYHYTIY